MADNSEFKRARSAKQKTVRLEQIANSAIELFDELPYHEITLTGITEKLDFSRINLYKYFSTKEEIYLYVLLLEEKSWIEDIQKVFEDIDTISVEKFSQLWANTLYNHRRLMRLQALNFIVLEKNATVETLVEFRKEAYKASRSLEKLIQRLFPEFSEKQVIDFLEYQLDYTIGMYPKTLISSKQLDSVEISGIRFMNEDFIQSCAQFVSVILLGIRNL